jgi:hypothetical protein
MKIRFGLHLDGQRGWLPRNSLGEITVGPLGLLDILETHLGLLQEQVSPSERIVQYRDCLRQCNSPQRFFHRSFQADELGTAATLLAWRDDWYLQGWDGQIPSASPPRIQDMGEVECFATVQVAASIGERLQRVVEAKMSRTVPIQEIELLDPLEYFPQCWRKILEHFPLRLWVIANNEAGGSGLLGQLQTALKAVPTPQAPSKISWQDDGSVTVVQAETRFLAGRWLAEKIDAVEGTSLLVAPVEGERLDGILVSSGRPRHGLRESSAFRPSLQVLPLVLEILWEPLNFYGLLQFLTHAVCPVPAYARRKLAGKLADKPGLGGTYWEQVLADIDAHYGGPESEIAQEVRRKIHFWVEHPRHDQAKGVELIVVIERVEALTEYFRKRLVDSDRARRMAFKAGLGQCQAAAAALKALSEQGATTILPRQLQKLVAQATARGSDNPLLVAEVGSALTVTHPGAAIEPCTRVLWWQMGMPALPHSYPWSTLEIESLAQVGVKLPDVGCLLDRAAEEWLRPIMAARNELILVLPPKGEEVRPVWLMIDAIFKDIPVIQLEASLIRSEHGMSVVPHQPLPGLKRFWQLPAGVAIAMRPQESFSSLEKQIFNPYHWLLEYPAKLRASRILSIAGDFQLFGNLAHRLVEVFFRLSQDQTPREAAFDTWFNATFDRLVHEEGAVLLMPGRRSDLEGFRIKLQQSVHELRQQLAEAQVSTVHPEMALTGIYAGGDLIGFADLVLEKSDGSRAIIDMKWSGAQKYPTKLRENRHLQLAIYAELVRQKFSAWPHVAYFLLDRGRLLSTDNHWFPSADVVSKNTEENTAQLWGRFLQSWHWRQSQFKEGFFEVCLENIPETEDSQAPEDGLPPETMNPLYNDFLALAGWEE